MSYEKLLNDTCTIQERSETQDDLGEIDKGWTNKATNVKCRRSRGGGSSTNTLGGDYPLTVDDFKFYFLPTASIVVGDRIVFGSENYEIIRVEKDSSGHHYEVIGRRLTHE